MFYGYAYELVGNNEYLSVHIRWKNWKDGGYSFKFSTTTSDFFFYIWNLNKSAILHHTDFLHELHVYIHD